MKKDIRFCIDHFAVSIMSVVGLAPSAAELPADTRMAKAEPFLYTGLARWGIQSQPKLPLCGKHFTDFIVSPNFLKYTPMDHQCGEVWGVFVC